MLAVEETGTSTARAERPVEGVGAEYEDNKATSMKLAGE